VWSGEQKTAGMLTAAAGRWAGADTAAAG
jgi:hypothetical protein